MDKPTDDEEDSTFGEFIEDKDTPDPENSTEQILLREKIKEAINDLPPREAMILTLRFGLNSGEYLTLEQVGQKLGVTRERIRQLEGQALSRLRHHSVRRKLHDFL